MKYHIYVLNSCCCSWLVYSRPIVDVQYAVESSIKQPNNKAPSFFSYSYFLKYNIKFYSFGVWYIQDDDHHYSRKKKPFFLKDD